MPNGRTQRAKGIGPARLGVEGSLSAPGLHVPQAQYPGYFDAAKMVRELLASVGSATATMAEMRKTREYASEDERQRVASAQKSQLALDLIQTDLTTFQHIEGNTDLQDVEGWLTDHAEDYEPEVMEFYKPRLLEAVIKIRKEKVREALWVGYVEEGSGIQQRLVSDSFVNEQDRVDLQDDFEALEKDCIAFGEKPNQFRARVLEPAARAVAAAAMTDADVERADWLAGLLEARGRADLAEDVRRNARLSRSKYLYQVIAEEINGTENTKGLEKIGKRVDKLADSDLLFEGQRDQLNIKLGIRREEFHHARQRRVEEKVFGYLSNKPGGLDDRSKVVASIRKAVADGIFTSKEALPLLEKVGKELKNLDSRRRVLAKVGGTAVVPLTKEDDKAVYQLADELYEPDDRQGRALFFAAAEYVPAKTIEQMTRGINSGDQEIIKAAMQDYLVLRNEYPGGADKVFEKMDAKGQARVMAILMQAEESGVDLTKPEHRAALLDQQAPALISLVPVDMTKQDLLNDLFLNPDLRDENDNVARTLLQRRVGENFKLWLAEGWDSSEYVGVDRPSTETVNRYITLATDTFRALLSNNWPVTIASDRAKRIAVNKIAAEMRPIKYNGQIMDLGGGPPTAKGLGDKLFADAEAAIEKHNWAEPRKWAKKYTPTWSDAHRGYVYINNTDGKFAGRTLFFWSDGVRYPYVSHGWGTKPPEMNRGVIELELDRASGKLVPGEVLQAVPEPTRDQARKLLNITAGPDAADSIWLEAKGDFERAMWLAKERNSSR